MEKPFWSFKWRTILSICLCLALCLSFTTPAVYATKLEEENITLSESVLEEESDDSISDSSQDTQSEPSDEEEKKSQVDSSNVVDLPEREESALQEENTSETADEDMISHQTTGAPAEEATEQSTISETEDIQDTDSEETKLEEEKTELDKSDSAEETIPSDTSSSDVIATEEKKSQEIVKASANDDFDIEDGVLVRYYGDGGEVKLPEEVIHIGDYAFYNCENLDSIQIPEGIISIGESAFWNCQNLSSIVIPESVTSIGEEAFASCSNLINVKIPDSVKTIGRNAFDKTAWLEAQDQDFVIAAGILLYYQGISEDVIIPNNVTSIGIGAFENCWDFLQHVTIPDSVSVIGDYAFSGCNNLTSVEIPDSVTYIGAHAFENCSSLETVILSNNLEKIGDNAFDNTPWMLKQQESQEEWVIVNGILLSYQGDSEEAIIPYGVTSIGEGAFEWCDTLKHIVIPDSAINIGANAFLGCGSLESVSMNHGVINIGKKAFADCYTLEEIVIPDSVTNIDVTAFDACSQLQSITVDADNESYSSIDGVLYNKAKTTLIKCPEGRSESCTIPNSVIRIGENAFNGCMNLESVTIPTSVTSIGECAFCSCESLKTIVIPDSVTSINQETFYGCQTLSNVEMSDNITYIGEGAFANCGSLKNIKLSNSLTIIGESAFESCSIETIAIPSTVTSIRYSAFEGCLFESVMIPSTVTSIGYRAFGYSLEESYDDFIIFGYGITAAEEYAQDNGFIFAELNSSSNLPFASIDVLEDSVDGTTEIGTYYIRSGDALVLECNIPLEYFESVAVDGVVVDPSNYTVVSGSTVLTFSSKYLDTLHPGVHTVTLNYDINGKWIEVSTNIRIVTTPDGENQNSGHVNTDTENTNTMGNSGENHTGAANGNATVGHTEGNNAIANVATDVNIENEFVPMSATVVDVNGNPLVGYTLEIHSNPVSAELDDTGRGSFGNIQVGDHTLYLKDVDGHVVASKSIVIAFGDEYSIDGNVVYILEESAFTLNTQYDGEKLVLLSVENDSPDTGDHAMPWIWILMISISTVGILIILIRNKNKLFVK